MSSVCAACGTSLAADERFCRVCGRSVPVAVVTAPGVALVGPPETSGKAIVSLVCGLLFFVPLLFIAAIVFGHLSLSEIRRSAGRLKGDGMAIAGLVLGYLWIVGIPIILIVAAIAIPNLLRARMAANESSAVGGVRTLLTAEAAYADMHPDKGFTCSLSELASARLISGALASGQKNGYVFDLQKCTPGANGESSVKFQVVAHPLTPNQTGVRVFCSDESAVVKVDAEGSAESCLQNGSSSLQ